LPRSDGAQILEAADHLGGRDSWGFVDLIEDRLHFEPGILLDQLLPRMIDVLNELMEATPVQRLPRVSLKPGNQVPPGSWDAAFSEHERQSIRWQLGI